jgi:hypothetical protein
MTPYQGDLKVAKAGLQGAAGPLPEREVSSQKLFFMTQSKDLEQISAKVPKSSPPG